MLSFAGEGATAAATGVSQVLPLSGDATTTSALTRSDPSSGLGLQATADT
jgi:hypothetical protein